MTKKDAADNEPLHIQELVPGSVCKLIIAAYASLNTKGSAASASANESEEEYENRLTKKITEMLRHYSIEVVEIEHSLHTDRSFAVLIFAHYLITASPDLETLRHDIREEASKLGISIRMQRSELFSYMHRI